MPVPWLAVGSLVLGNLDKIMAVVKPGFTRRNLDAVDNQTELLNQQISELQAAAAANAEQIRLLASQLKDVVAALEQAGLAAAAERAATRRLAVVALALAVMGLTTGILALIYYMNRTGTGNTKPCSSAVGRSSRSRPRCTSLRRIRIVRTAASGSRGLIPILVGPKTKI
jgi:hypothetical protein